MSKSLAVELAFVIGAWKRFRARRETVALNRAMRLAARGLTLVFLLYYIGFVTVGGAWFGMWQPQTWNGQPKAVEFLPAPCWC